MLRHCESTWHKEGRLAGQSDEAKLTEKGKFDAKKIAEKIKEKNIEIIYSSKLKRSIQTAEIIAEILNKKLIQINILNERNWGILQGRRDKDIYKELSIRFTYTPPDGESFKQFEKRILSFVKSIKKKYPGKIILLVTHAGVIEVLERKFRNKIQGAELLNGPKSLTY